MESTNPWAVESIMAFNYFLCPECDFQAKTPPSFEIHAIENHPRAKYLFESPVKSEQDMLNSVENLLNNTDHDVKDEPGFYFDIDLPEDNEDLFENVGEEEVAASHEAKMCLDAKEVIEETDKEGEEAQIQCEKCNEGFETLVDLGYHQHNVHAKVRTFFEMFVI